MSEHQSDEADHLEGITTALYELEGAIRGASADINAGTANWTDARQREQTAATLLAALIQAHATINAGHERGHDMNGGDYVTKAVTLTDALRAALKETP